MKTTEVETQGEKVYVCEVCGRSFSTTQALGGHMTGHNRNEAEAEPLPPARGAYETDVLNTLQTLGDPLRAKLAEIDQTLVEVEAERDDLRKARSEIVAVLSKFDPDFKSSKPGPKKPNLVDANRARASRQDAERVEWLAAYFVEHPEEFEEGFTANSLAGRVTEKMPKGLSVATAKRAIAELRDRGLVRADKVVKGGGMSFKLVASANGDGPHA